MLDLTSILFGFDGRINRAKCWLAIPVYLGICFVLMFIALMAISSFYQTIGSPSDLGSFVGRLPMYVFMLPSIVFATWSGAAIMIKRLHDRDRSGWWGVPFVIVPAVLNKMSGLLGDVAADILALLALALSIWALVETLMLKGTDGSNRFGADPRIEARSRRATA